MPKIKPLEELTIKGYKSIKELELKLNRDINILIGANGAGKSNFLSFFKFLGKTLNQELQNHVQYLAGMNEILYYGRKTTKQLSFRLSFGRDIYELILKSDVLYHPLIESEGVEFSGDTGTQKLTYTNLLESGFKTATEPIIRICYESMSRWKVFHFHDTGESSPMKRIVGLADNVDLHSDGGNIASFLYRIMDEEPKYYQSIKETVQLVLPSFGDFVLQPTRSETIQLRWREKDNETVFSVSQLSDGTLRFICLATLLITSGLQKLYTVIIDEPELGLHPYALQLLASLLKSASNEVQIIVSTQSSILVSCFEADKIIVVERQKVEGTNQFESVFKKLDTEPLRDWLEDYDLGQLWEMGQIGGRP